MVRALRVLPRRQREVLVLRYYDGASEAEIAEIAGHLGGLGQDPRVPRPARGRRPAGGIGMSTDELERVAGRQPARGRRQAGRRAARPGRAGTRIERGQRAGSAATAPRDRGRRSRRRRDRVPALRRGCRDDEAVPARPSPPGRLVALRPAGRPAGGQVPSRTSWPDAIRLTSVRADGPAQLSPGVAGRQPCDRRRRRSTWRSAGCRTRPRRRRLRRPGCSRPRARSRCRFTVRGRIGDRSVDASDAGVHWLLAEVAAADADRRPSRPCAPALIRPPELRSL